MEFPRLGIDIISSLVLLTICFVLVLERTNCLLFVVFSLSLDNDECTTGSHNCHSQATCTNTPGAFTCSCTVGFTGNGVSCSGKLVLTF